MGLREGVERVVAGHGDPPDLLVAHAESEGWPLVLSQTGHFAPKVKHVARPHEQAQRDQPQHGRERVPPTGGGTRIGHLPKSLPQVLELGDFERAASTAALTLGGLAGLWQLPSAPQRVLMGARSLSQSFLGRSLGT